MPLHRPHLYFFAAVALLLTSCADEPTSPSAEFLLNEPPPLATADGRLLRNGVSRADSLLLLGPSLNAESQGGGYTSSITLNCSTSHSTTTISGGCEPPEIIPATPRLSHNGGSPTEPQQTAPIVINFPRPITRFTISGNGAIFCSGAGNYGKVTSYGGNTQVGTMDMILRNQADCGTDSVTYGAKADITFASPVTKVIIDGPTPWTFWVSGSPGGRALANYNITWTQADAHDIRPIFFGSTPPTQAMKDAVNRAILKLQQAIPEGTIPADTVNLAAGACGPGSPAFNGIVRGLRIMVQVQPDTRPRRIAYAVPCKRRPGSSIPSVALISIKDSMELMLASSSNASKMLVEKTIIHEIVHALGVGQGARWIAQTNTADTLKPWFIGFYARTKFREYSPDYQGVYVPIQIDPRDHWSESRMGDELMTPVVSSTMVLSKITLGALADLGYSVNYTKAEPYELPPYNANIAQARLESDDEYEEMFIDCTPPEGVGIP